VNHTPTEVCREEARIPLRDGFQDLQPAYKADMMLQKSVWIFVEEAPKHHSPIALTGTVIQVFPAVSR
jgi:hypothetical protein